MFRIVLRFWRGLNPEIAIGFLAATVFWIGVLGWQAAYAPTEMEKQKCYEAAQHGDHKSEECKSLWEKATTDPVAFFTLWLVIFTGGLTISTVLLWIAGEKQLRHARRSAVIQARDMRESIAIARRSADTSDQALIAGQRAFVTVKSIDRSQYLILGTGEISAWQFFVTWMNGGNTPTRNFRGHVSMMLSETELPEDWDFPNLWESVVPAWKDQVLGVINAKEPFQSSLWNVPVEDIEEVIDGRKFLYMWGWAEYNDVFPNTPKRIVRFSSQIFAGGDARNVQRMSFIFTQIPGRGWDGSDEECDGKYPAGWKARDVAVKSMMRPGRPPPRKTPAPIPPVRT